MKSYIRKIFVLGMAAIIQGFAMSLFLFPHNIPSGGAAGISILLNFISGIPYAYTLWILNAGMLLVAVKWLGTSSALWTIYCVTVTSITVQLLTPYFNSPLSNVLIDLVCGSVLFGIGVGILFRMGASSGGMDILALIISKIKDYPPGKILFIINGTILLLTGLIVDWKVIIFALICQWIGTKIIDAIYCLAPKKDFKEVIVNH